MSTTYKSLLPVWNIPLPLNLQLGSRDPLGFQHYAAYFANRILSNITVLTRRARYYAFLAWALDELAAFVEPRLLTGRDMPYDEYNETLARFERYIALAEAVKHHKDGEDGCAWVGERRSRALARGEGKHLPLDVSLTIAEGSNGVLADYRQSMQSLGFIAMDPGVLPDTLTDQGKLLADAFRKAIGASKARRISTLCLGSNSIVENQELLINGRKICLSLVSKEESALLTHALLNGEHASIVAELSPLLKKARRLNEGDILKSYLSASARQGMSFELRQIAVHQVFALACLTVFKSLVMVLIEEHDIQIEAMAQKQLLKEGIQNDSRLASLIRRIKWEDELKIILSMSPDSPLIGILPALRLLYWISRIITSEPSLIVTESIEAVLLDVVAQLFSKRDTSVHGLLSEFDAILINTHQRIFTAKRKQPWIEISGKNIRLLDENAEVSISFPPNSVRLGSLIQLFRDLKVHNG